MCVVCNVHKPNRKSKIRFKKHAACGAAESGGPVRGTDASSEHQHMGCCWGHAHCTAALQFHTAVAIGDFMVVFAASTQHARSAQRHVEAGSAQQALDSVPCCWQQQQQPVSKGSAHNGQRHQRPGNNVGVLFGGLDLTTETTFNDTWMFNPVNCSWTQVNAPFAACPGPAWRSGDQQQQCNDCAWRMF